MTQIRKGDKFGYWTVMRPAQPGCKSQRRFMCRCVCGTERAVFIHVLTSGDSKSCRCKQGEHRAQTLAAQQEARP